MEDLQKFLEDKHKSSIIAYHDWELKLYEASKRLDQAREDVYRATMARDDYFAQVKKYWNMLQEARNNDVK